MFHLERLSGRVFSGDCGAGGLSCKGELKLVAGLLLVLSRGVNECDCEISLTVILRPTLSSLRLARSTIPFCSGVAALVSSSLMPVDAQRSANWWKRNSPPWLLQIHLILRLYWTSTMFLNK